MSLATLIARFARRRRRVGLLAGLAVLSTLRVGATRIAEERTEAPCILARTEAPYRNYGYDHIVRLQNRCDAAVRCRVSSDVRSDPLDVGVDPGARVEVVLWRGSPVRDFNAKVDCRWAK
jgi:hypothetical protein